MQYKQIYLGVWTLGSTIQLKEFYQAMAFQKSSYFKPKEIRAWQKGMKVSAIEYITQAINSVNGNFENGIMFDVLEDGMMVIAKEVEDVKKDYQYLDQFMNTKLFPFWRNLSVKDVSLPKVFSEENPCNPVVLQLADASEDELEQVFKFFNVIAYKKVDLEHGQVWIGEKLVVLNNFAFDEHDLREAIRYLMFARLYEMQLKELLNVQRTLWNQIEGIRHRKYYKNSELPIVRDKALTIQSQANFFKSRSKQINQFLLWREKLIDDYLSDHVLSSTFRGFFLSLKSTQHYLHELWEMTATYANSTVESISLLYSDNQQRELQTLQKLFLVSAVISVLSLGTIAGSRMLTYSPEGKVISKALIASWSFDSFVFYGAIAFLVSVVVYLFFYLIFSKFQQAKHIAQKDQK